MTSVVFDASALIALLRSEDGKEIVEQHLDGAIMSTVNFGEVIRKNVERGKSAAQTRDLIEALRIEFADHDMKHAFATGVLRSATKSKGLSYADCACLALGMERGMPVLTTDGKWLQCGLNADIRLIRKPLPPESHGKSKRKT